MHTIIMCTTHETPMTDFESLHCCVRTYLRERSDAAFRAVRLHVHVSHRAARLQHSLETPGGTDVPTGHKETVHLRGVGAVVDRLDNSRYQRVTHPVVVGGGTHRQKRKSGSKSGKQPRTNVRTTLANRGGKTFDMDNNNVRQHVFTCEDAMLLMKTERSEAAFRALVRRLWKTQKNVVQAHLCGAVNVTRLPTILRTAVPNKEYGSRSKQPPPPPQASGETEQVFRTPSANLRSLA